MKRPGQQNQASTKHQRERLNSFARAPKRVTKREVELSLEGRILSSRRTRRLFATSTVISILLLVVLVLVATFSPLLAVKEIYVQGTERLKPEQISKALSPHLGTPLPLLRESLLAESLAEFSEIETFSATAVPPNGLRIRIVERQAICIVKVGNDYFLHDPAGVKLEKAGPKNKLPEIIVSGDPRSSQRFRDSIDVLMALPVELLDQVETIEAKTKDDVRLKLRGVQNRNILWGDSSESILKSKVLAALMENQSGSETVTFDVSSPNAPVVRIGDY
jgi:cell division protein FtsQ